jgi:5'-nucleotidase
MNWKIYVDLDGVLADFDGYYTKLTGIGWDQKEQISNDEKWAALAPHPNFFRDLPWIKDAKRLWNFVKDFDTSILSAASSHFPQSKPQKIEWCQRELGLVGDRVIIVDRKREKVPYAKPGSILIDDSQINIDRWNAAGGRGILFWDAITAIRELQQIVGGS